MAIVGYLKAEHGNGHGHANALVGWTLPRQHRPPGADRWLKAKDVLEKPSGSARPLP